MRKTHPFYPFIKQLKSFIAPASFPNNCTSEVAMELPVVKLKNCIFLQNRYALLDKLPKNSLGAEVGVLAGDFSEAILNTCKPKELVLIDLFDCKDFKMKNRFDSKGNLDFVEQRFKKEIQESVVKVLQGNSWTILEMFPDNYFDWIYIDAAHDYHSVKKDLEQAHRIIKNDGLIIMNDYIMFDHISGVPYGVVQATNEFMIMKNYEMAYYAFHPQLFCDVAIRRSKPKQA